MSTILFDNIKTQSKLTDTILVSFSGGKDSVVVLDLCFKYFKNVIPFFMYIVPSLEFQEDSMKWFENKYNTKILRVPHFELSNFMRYGSFRQPNLDVGIISVKDVYDFLRLETGAYWIAGGERIDDSIVRRAMIKNSGTIDKKRGRTYPVAYWKKKEVVNYIKYKKLKLSKEQEKLGFSFRSLAGSELAVIKQLYPSDYARILNVFPFAEAGVRRFELNGD